MRPYREFIYAHAASASCTVIGHRGACAYFPENTLASFKGALEMGADMVELDVQRTRDGEVVVMHDERVNRCTDGRGRVADFSFAGIRALDAGSWFAGRFAGEKVPALEEVLELCRGRLAINVEIKTEAVGDAARGGIEEAVLGLVARSGMNGHVVYSSFDPRALAHLRQVDESAPIAVLYKKKHFRNMGPREIVAGMNADCFNCSREELGNEWMEEILNNHIPVNVYTVNSKRDIARLVRAGVSGIFTNKPDLMRAVLDTQ
ncbi:MAG: hypothetical protein EPN93_15945 [Spirochaetes bacterium]|nr:MAG: hypothetical protein EPN93_15945 [Spirochaetota bacterium]